MFRLSTITLAFITLLIVADKSMAQSQTPSTPAAVVAKNDYSKAQVYVYPDCKDGRIVADVVRIDKGHTEGLEPKGGRNC